MFERRHYKVLADYWKERLSSIKSVESNAWYELTREYEKFTEYLYNTQDNFRISHFDAHVGYERTN